MPDSHADRSTLQRRHLESAIAAEDCVSLLVDEVGPAPSHREQCTRATSHLLSSRPRGTFGHFAPHFTQVHGGGSGLSPAKRQCLDRPSTGASSSSHSTHHQALLAAPHHVVLAAPPPNHQQMAAYRFVPQLPLAGHCLYAYAPTGANSPHAHCLQPVCPAHQQQKSAAAPTTQPPADKGPKLA